MCGLDPLIHIPDRLFEGYGPNTEAVRMLAEKGARLLVTVDCGTTSIAPRAEAKTLGLDVVTIDHHQTEGIEKLQANPLLFGIDGGTELSASGTAYCSPTKPVTKRPPRAVPRASRRRRARWTSRHGRARVSRAARSRSTTP